MLCPTPATFARPAAKLAPSTSTASCVRFGSLRFESLISVLCKSLLSVLNLKLRKPVLHGKRSLDFIRAILKEHHPDQRLADEIRPEASGQSSDEWSTGYSATVHSNTGTMRCTAPDPGLRIVQLRPAALTRHQVVGLASFRENHQVNAATVRAQTDPNPL